MLQLQTTHSSTIYSMYWSLAGKKVEPSKLCMSDQHTFLAFGRTSKQLKQALASLRTLHQNKSPLTSHIKGWLVHANKVLFSHNTKTKLLGIPQVFQGAITILSRDRKIFHSASPRLHLGRRFTKSAQNIILYAKEKQRSNHILQTKQTMQRN